MSTYYPPVDLYQRINPLLQDPLSTTSIETLAAQLASIEAVRYELSYKRCEWLEMLLRERDRARMPKDKEYTDFDRKTMLEANTSVIEQDYQFLVSLEEIVKERIALGMIILQGL